MKYTFDVAKCDKIFDELHEGGYIKSAYTLPPTDEIKRKAYCKWHKKLLMIAIFSVDRSNRSLMRND